jgi:hypothetical protein
MANPNGPHLKLKGPILEYLQANCQGRANAVKSLRLTVAIGLHPRQVRQVRAAIAELRKEKNLICSSVRPPCGYYMAENMNEKNQCTAQLWARIKEMMRIARDLDESGAREFSTWVQKELFQ